MGIKKQGVMVTCEKCQLVRSDGNGGFEITVPMRIEETGVEGFARLHCTVTDECHHQIRLLGWEGSNHEPIEISDGYRKRIADVLDSVAKQRVCGNTRICPLEVVRIVEERTR